MDLSSFWKTLAQEQNIPVDQVDSVLKAFSDPKAVEAFGKEFVPRPTFHSQLDRQREDMKALYEGNYKQWYDKEVAPEILKRDQALATERAKVSAFEQTYGALEGFTPAANGTVKSPSGDVFSREDVQKLLDARDAELAQRTVSVIKTGLKASIDYYNRFKEPLDVDAWETFAVENNLPPNIAYEKYIEPKLQVQREKDFAERLKKEREEAVMEYKTRNNFPIDAKPREISPLSAHLNEKQEGPKTEAEKFALFRAALQEQ